MRNSILLCCAITAFCAPILQLSEVAASEFSIDRERATAFAEEYFASKFGQCAIGEPWEYADPLGTRVAYMFPVQIGANSFTEPQDIESWESGYGRIVVSARSYLSPVLECCAAAPWEIVNDDMFRAIIRQETGESDLSLVRIYYMPLGIRLFEYAGALGNYLVDPMNLDIISAEEFAEFTEGLRNPENLITPETHPGEFKDRWEAFERRTLTVSQYIDGYETIPYFDWEYGCCPTAGAMLFGYWENHHEVGRIITGYFTHADHKYHEINHHVPDVECLVAGGMTTDTTYYPPYDYSYGGTYSDGIANGLLRTSERKNLAFSIYQETSANFTHLVTKINSDIPVIWNNCWERPSGTACHCMTAVGYGDGELLYLHNTWDNMLDERWTWSFCSIVSTDSYTGDIYTYGVIFSQGITSATPTESLDDRNLRLTAPCPGSGLNTEPYAADPGDLPEYTPGGEMLISWTGADSLLPLIIQLSLDNGVSFGEIGFMPGVSETDSFAWAIPGTLTTSGGRIRILQFADGEVISGDGSYNPFSIGGFDSCAFCDPYERGDAQAHACWLNLFPIEYEAAFDGDDDVDWFAFVAIPTDSYSISIGDPASPTVTLINSDSDTVAFHDGAGGSVAFDFIPTAPDIYYLAIAKSASSGPLGCYSISIAKDELVDTSCMAPDFFEPDNDELSATPILCTDEMRYQRHTVHAETDTDYYEVDLDDGDKFWLTTRTFENLKLKVYLYNPTGSLVAIGSPGSGAGYNCVMEYSAHEAGTHTFKIFGTIAPPAGTPLCYDVFYNNYFRYEYLEGVIPTSDTTTVGRYYSFKPYFAWAYFFEYTDYPGWMTVLSDSIIRGTPPVGDTTYHFSVVIPLAASLADTATVALYVRDCPQLEEFSYDTLSSGEYYVRHLCWDGVEAIIIDKPAWLTFEGDSIFGEFPDSLSMDAYSWVAYTPYCADTQISGIFGLNAIEEAAAPEKFALNAPYPNPTNTSALISFAAPAAGTAVLKIIDITGRQVRREEFVIERPGVFREILNLDDISSGTYLIKLTFDGEDRYRKLVLMK